MDEVPLTGGHVSQGIVRIGDTVRRPAKDSTPRMRSLLLWLEAEGFPAPRFLGLDAEGRETLSFVEGYVIPKHLSPSPAQVFQTTALLRRFHTLTSHSPLRGDAPLVLHGDAKPRNTVFGDPEGGPLAFIDFDNTRPGEPREDLYWTAWTFALRSTLTDVHPISSQAERLVAAAEGYALSQRERRALVPGILALQSSHISEALALLPSLPASERQMRSDALNWTKDEHAWTLRHADLLQRALA